VQERSEDQHEKTDYHQQADQKDDACSTGKKLEHRDTPCRSNDGVAKIVLMPQGRKREGGVSYLAEQEDNLPIPYAVPLVI
jgi:hypothetical protein